MKLPPANKKEEKSSEFADKSIYRKIRPLKELKGINWKVRFNSFLFHFNEHLVRSLLLFLLYNQVCIIFPFHIRLHLILVSFRTKNVSKSSATFHISWFQYFYISHLSGENENYSFKFWWKELVSFSFSFLIIFYVTTVDCRKMQSPSGCYYSHIWTHGTKSLRR